MKTPNIKFNLKFYDANGNEEVVRTLDDLREKCNLSDLYDYYESGVLGRWLSSIGQVETAEQLSAVKAESDLRKRIQFVLQLLGITVDEQTLADFTHIQERKGLVSADRPTVQNERGNVPSFMALISRLFEICGKPQDIYSVEQLQGIERKAIPCIRKLVEHHESAFAQYIEGVLLFESSLGYNQLTSRIGLWWVLVILYSNSAFREFVQHVQNCNITWADDSHTRLRLGKIYDLRNYYIIADSNQSLETEFCEEKFGWSLKG